MDVFDDCHETRVIIPPDKEFKHRWKLFNARFEYAWRYFDFHAKQRMTMFNFFIVFSGFLVNACSNLFKDKQWDLLLIASIFGVVTTLFFIFLERRNEELVHIPEDVLRALEKDVLFKDFHQTIMWPRQRCLTGNMIQQRKSMPIGIFVRQDYDEEHDKKSNYMHGRWLPKIQWAIWWIYIYFIYIAAKSLGGLSQCEPMLLSP